MSFLMIRIDYFDNIENLLEHCRKEIITRNSTRPTCKNVLASLKAQDKAINVIVPHMLHRSTSRC